MRRTDSIFPEGESFRNAVRWISRVHEYDLSVIEEACQRYNLTPVEEEFMMRHFLNVDRLHADQLRVSQKEKV